MTTLFVFYIASVIVSLVIMMVSNAIMPETDKKETGAALKYYAYILSLTPGLNLVIAVLMYIIMTDMASMKNK